MLFGLQSIVVFIPLQLVLYSSFSKNASQYFRKTIRLAASPVEIVECKLHIWNHIENNRNGIKRNLQNSLLSNASEYYF